jgi:peptidoglycan/xylan/chitin deacetylase (PgdA/CDA1 family)
MVAKIMSAALTYHFVGAQVGKYLNKVPSVEVEVFKKQLKYLTNNYNIVTTDEFVNSKSHDNILLTFDDGLKCHYDVVAPILSDLNIPAIFFVSSGPIVHREFLLVHQLQILISESKYNKSIFNALFDFSAKHCDSMESLIKQYPSLHIHQYESRDYNFIKKSFQIFIDLGIAKDFLKELLDHYCSDVTNLFDNTYLNIDDCREMINDGFDIGGHSRSHSWMEYLKRDTILSEVADDVVLFNKLGLERRYYCYPYGSYSNNCIDIIRDAGFSYGFTIEAGEFDCMNHDRFKIKRFDVNEFFTEDLF